MAKKIQVVGIKRKEVDTEKLALAFILIAKSLREQEEREAAQSIDDQEVDAA